MKQRRPLRPPSDGCMTMVIPVLFVVAFVIRQVIR